jgi:outer membrane lipoprotein
MKKMKKLLLIMVSFILVGCASGISKQSLSRVTVYEPFLNLQQQPGDFIGETVVFGGKIIVTQPMENATELTILQLALDDQDRPRDNNHSDGRFLVVSDQFLDPAIYKKGDLITVVGKLVSSEKRLIGEREYRYPKIKAGEIKRWEPGRDTYPRIRFGFGIGASF